MTAPSPRLMIITDLATVPASRVLDCVERASAAARPGAVAVQLRDKERPIGERLALGRSLRDLTRRYGQSLVVNGRCDLALALGADGVHLPEGDLTPAEARGLLGPGAWVSAACHDPEQLPRGVDAIVLSPIAAPRKGRPALGMDGLRRARARLDGRGASPQLLALGGVGLSEVASCLAAGGQGVAVIGAAYDGTDLRALLAALDAESPR